LVVALETIERFAGEAWEANLALLLYEAATNPEGPDTDAILGYMPDGREEWMGTARRRRRPVAGL
jgi:hypothetical protein